MRDAFEVVSAAVIRRLSAIPTNAPSSMVDVRLSMAVPGAVSPAAPTQLNDLAALTATMQQPQTVWNTWPLDPSRPASPDDRPMGADTFLHDFFFDPFGTIPSMNDLLTDFDEGISGDAGQPT